MSTYNPIFLYNFFSVFLWAILTFLFIREKKTRDKIFLAIIFVQFTWLAWQRDFSIGQDTLQYYYAFQEFKSYSFIQLINYNWEPGYCIWNWIVAYFGGNFHIFLLLTSIFINFSIIRFIYKYSSLPWLSIVIFVAFGFYFGSLHILRQYIAIGFILFSYKYLIDKKLVPFAVLVLCATAFHMSAILFIFTYFVARREVNSSVFLGIFTAGIMFVFLLGDLLLPYMVVFQKYEEVYLKEQNSGEGYGMLLLLFVILTGGLLLKPRQLTINQKVFYWTIFIATVIQPFSTFVSIVARFVIYWGISVCIYIPMVIRNEKNENFRILLYVFSIIALTIFFVFITNADEGKEVWATYKWYNPQIKSW